jgi:hypothetical protein
VDFLDNLFFLLSISKTYILRPKQQAEIQQPKNQQKTIGMTIAKIKFVPVTPVFDVTAT